MKEDPKLITNENLNDINFESWEFMIINILRSEGVDGYIESDVIKDLTTRLKKQEKLKIRTTK